MKSNFFKDLVENMSKKNGSFAHFVDKPRGGCYTEGKKGNQMSVPLQEKG
jgi:hypothetical protein